MGRRGFLLLLSFSAAALITACGTTSSSFTTSSSLTTSSSFDTSNLTEVQLSSSQALPPPYGSAHAVLTSAGSLAGFQQSLVSHHIGVTTNPSDITSNDGCTGGVEYTIVLNRGGGNPATTLDAYDCGGRITGNMTGDVSGFLAYVGTLLAATPSGSATPSG
jgi:hypothetical protein